jgi:drug/metabolite transporter (DMT)-like permease
MGLGEACAVGSALTWSGGVIIYKRLGEILPPLQLNLLKNLIVLAVLVPTLLLVPGIGWPTMSMPTVLLTLLSGVLGIAVADTLYFRALNTLGAARMGIIGNLYSPFVIVLSFLFLSERLTTLQMIGFVLVSSGVVLVTRRKAEKILTPKQLRAGVLYGAAAVILMAIAIVMVKRVLEGQPLLWVVTLRLIGGAIGLATAFFWRREPLLPSDPALPPLRWRILVAAMAGGLQIYAGLGGGDSQRDFIDLHRHPRLAVSARRHVDQKTHRRCVHHFRGGMHAARLAELQNFAESVR